MARDHGRIHTAIWSDDDFRRLTVAAQHLYLMLVTDPSLSYAGVTDWRPNRIVPRAHGWTIEQLETAAAELVDRLYIVIDDQTEEVLVRSFVRNDGLMKQRHMGVSMARAQTQIASNELRGIVVYELQRLKAEEPELKAWTALEVLRVVDQTAIDPADYPLGNPTIQPPGEPPVHTPFHTSVHPPVQHESGGAVHPPVQPPSTPSPSPLLPLHGGYVSGEERVGAGERTPASNPSQCELHPDGTDKPCVGCARARRHREETEVRDRAAAAEARSTAARQAAADRAAAIADCGLCDEHGYRGTTVCDHVDHTETARHGVAAARAALTREPRFTRP